jgi:hypothetical protein
MQGADLQGTDMRGAKYMTPIQVRAANNWNKAMYSKEFRALVDSGAWE